MKWSLFLLLLACKPDHENGQATFYQLNHQTYTNLYIDGLKRGNLYPVKQMPVCGDNVAWYVITMELSIGSHKCALGDDNGNMLQSVDFVVSEGCKQVKIP